MQRFSLGEAIELAERTDKSIEVLRVGTFVDGKGRKVTISANDLDQFVANFKSGAAGQEVPFDIDHQFTQAAGWLRGLKREEDLLVAMPEWNELGVELIGKKIYRYISATIDMAKKVITALSLVNFPAVKGLQPIELGATPPTAGEENPLLGAPLASLFIFSSNQETTMPGDQNLQPNGENTTGQAATPTALAAATPPVTTAVQPVTLAAPVTPVAAPATPVAPAAPEATQPGFNVDGLMASLRQQMSAELGQFQTAMAAELAKLSDERNKMVTATMQQLREEQELAQLSMQLTSTGDHALPTTPDELKALLSAIAQPQRQSVIALLQNIHKSGTVTFAETGTSAGKKPTDKVELTGDLAGILRDHLKGGGKVEEFFALNADLLGSMDRYDLAQFTK